MAGKNGAVVDKVEQKVRLVPLQIKVMKLKIRGTSSLLMSRLPPEVLEKIKGRQGGEAQLPLPPKNPDQCFRNSIHLMPGENRDGDWSKKPPKVGFPAVGFKKAMVRAANDMDVPMVLARRAFHVMDDADGLVELRFDEMRHHEAAARNSSGSGVDIRHRAEFIGWECTLTIRYNASIISAEQVTNICSAAGFGVGVGEERPVGPNGGSGIHGCWEV